MVFEHWGGDIDPHVLAQAQQAIDLDADSASCPACGASFAPASKSCPECGLCFG